MDTHSHTFTDYNLIWLIMGFTVKKAPLFCSHVRLIVYQLTTHLTTYQSGPSHAGSTLTSGAIGREGLDTAGRKDGNWVTPLGMEVRAVD